MMKFIKKIKYNSILGVIIGFFLSQLVIAEGYALLVRAEQHSESIGIGIPQVLMTFLKILAVGVFIITVLIFNTKRVKRINFNKISIYLFLSIIVSVILAIEGVLISVSVAFKINPNLEDYIGKDYFISINMFFLMSFIGVSIFIIAFSLLVNRKVKYIKYLTKEVKLIKEEGFGKTIEGKGRDELYELCESINNMSVELGEKIEKEKREEKNKNELITNISHDLKTPLTSLVGFLDILNNKDIDDKAREEYISIAYNKSLRLKELVNELFEYTKLTSYDVKISKVKFNISNLINQIVGESILDFSEKNIEVILENPYKELYWDVDLKLFSRVFENLIGNAQKYSDKDSIFKVIVKEDLKDIKISFINKCEEVNAYHLEKIFEKFYRLDKSRSSDNEGSGLGLTIAKRIVELHNGELKVEKEGDYIKFNIILKKE